MYIPINSKLDLNLFVDLTDSETQNEEIVGGTSVRGGDKGGASQGECRSFEGEQARPHF